MLVSKSLFRSVDKTHLRCEILNVSGRALQPAHGAGTSAEARSKGRFAALDLRVAIFLIGLCACLVLLDMVWLTVSPLTLKVTSLQSFVPTLIKLVTLGGIGLLWRLLRRFMLIAAALTYMVVFAALSTILSYIVMGLDRPLVDDTLASFDQWLGFDWDAYATLIRTHDWGLIFGFAYVTLIPQIAIVTAILGLFDLRRALYRLIGTLSLSLLFTVILSGWIPAVGAYLHYGLSEFGSPIFGAPTLAVHDGQLREIDFDQIHGLISFPSYHAAAGFSLILACWPFHRLRYIICLIEGLLILSVPAFGEHYLSDVIAGIGVAVLSDWLWRFAMKYSDTNPALTRGIDLSKGAFDVSNA